MVDEEHECVFVEEQESSGRLILPPCIVCGMTAMDALGEIRAYQQAHDLSLSVIGEQRDVAQDLRAALERIAKYKRLDEDYRQESRDRRNIARAAIKAGVENEGGL